MSFFNAVGAMLRRLNVYHDAPRRRPGRGRSAAPPCLETLEGRCLLSSFVWQNSWGARFPEDHDGYGDSFTYAAAFGASATVDGQITDVGSASDIGPAAATAKAVASDTGPYGGAGFVVTAAVYFWRTFELSDSPNNWSGTLDGVLTGDLYSDEGGLGHVSSYVKIVAGVFDDFSEAPPPIILANFGGFWGPEHVDVSEMDGGMLSDGTYTVMGLLTVGAYGYPCDCSPYAVSYFWPGMVMNVDATPLDRGRGPSTPHGVGNLTGTHPIPQAGRAGIDSLGAVVTALANDSPGPHTFFSMPGAEVIPDDIGGRASWSAVNRVQMRQPVVSLALDSTLPQTMEARAPQAASRKDTPTQVLDRLFAGLHDRFLDERLAESSAPAVA